MESAIGMKNDRVHLQVCRSISCWNAGDQIADEPGNACRHLKIFVPYTTPDLTRDALAGASGLAADLRVEAVLVAVREIPYPLPLDYPDVQPALLIEKLMALAEGMSCPVRIELILARSKSDALRRAIRPGSLVLIAAKRHWWRTGEERLARTLARAGCSVSLLISPEGKRDHIALPGSLEAASTSAGVADREISHV